MVPAISRKVPPASRYSGIQPLKDYLHVRGCHPLRLTFPGNSTSNLSDPVGPYNPTMPSIVVWALSLSLATTQKITVVFSSSGYLDVSVPRVRLLFSDVPTSSERVAPFGYLRV